MTVVAGIKYSATDSIDFCRAVLTLCWVSEILIVELNIQESRVEGAILKKMVVYNLKRTVRLAGNKMSVFALQTLHFFPETASLLNPGKGLRKR